VFYLDLHVFQAAITGFTVEFDGWVTLSSVNLEAVHTYAWEK